MANSNHDHEHDGHVHDGHGHTHDGLPPHSHGEPTGNAIEKIGFTRSQFLRMCLAGVAAGAAVPLGAQAQAQAPKAWKPRTDSRSEEHTSELQSHSDLVCRLLLEKKKTK